MRVEQYPFQILKSLSERASPMYFAFLSAAGLLMGLLSLLQHFIAAEWILVLYVTLVSGSYALVDGAPRFRRAFAASAVVLATVYFATRLSS